MWALTKKKPEAGLWMERVPIPEVGPNDVKIKIHKTAICGTDVHIYQWNDWARHTIPVGLTAGPRVRGRDRGGGVRGGRTQRGGPGVRRGTHHLREMPQLPGRTQGELPGTPRAWG